MDDLKTGQEKQFDGLRESFAAFIGAQTTASIILMLALCAALVAANSPYAEVLETIRHYPLGIVFGQQTIEWCLLHLVNDGLIALFFFLISLEVKRELIAGELHDSSRTGFLISAALGGMAVAAGLYLAVNMSVPSI